MDMGTSSGQAVLAPREEDLRLDRQLCFPLYAAARKIVAAYHPFLKEIGLTYTQYIAMMVFWEKKEISAHDLGETLYLDSGTLTPVMKRLERLGLITKERSKTDERVVIARITEKGEALKQKAVQVPCQMAARLMEKGDIDGDCVDNLKKELYDIIDRLK